MLLVDQVWLGSTVSCCQCGVRFAFDHGVHAHRLRDGKDFFCPNGHSQHYGDTEAKRLRRELDAANERVQKARDQTERERRRVAHERRSHAATKGQLTKTKKRAAAGVCPCCNRTFRQLAQHMATKHPEYATEPQKGAT